MPASARFQISSNGGTTWQPVGAPIAGAAALPSAAGSTSIKARLESLAGVQALAWDIAACSDGVAAPAVSSLPDKSAQLSVDRSVAGSYLLRARVNGGLTRDTVAVLAIKVLTDAGLEVLAAGESTEGDGAYGWVRPFNAIARFIDPGGGPGSAMRLRADGETLLSGDVTLAAGEGIALSQHDGTKTIQIAASGSAGLPAPYTATTTSGTTSVEASDTTGAATHLALLAQVSTSGAGADVVLGPGAGTTTSGRLRLVKTTTSGEREHAQLWLAEGSPPDETPVAFFVHTFPEHSTTLITVRSTAWVSVEDSEGTTLGGVQQLVGGFLRFEADPMAFIDGGFEQVLSESLRTAIADMVTVDLTGSTLTVFHCGGEGPTAIHWKHEIEVSALVVP